MRSKEQEMGNDRRAKPVTASLRHLVSGVGALCCVLVPTQPAHAQAFPSKNVQMVVPYTAGGSIDLFSRAIAQRLSVAWGRSVVVDNRPGASGDNGIPDHVTLHLASGSGRSWNFTTFGRFCAPPS